jgi:hypothetical protein
LSVKALQLNEQFRKFAVCFAKVGVSLLVPLFRLFATMESDDGAYVGALFETCWIPRKIDMDEVVAAHLQINAFPCRVSAHQDP